MNPISRKDQLLQMIENEPEQVFLHYALAKEFEKELNWIEASKNYQLILQIDANYIGVYYHYGKLLEHLGQIDEAKTIYQTGINKALVVNDLHSKSELQTAWLALEIEALE